MAVPLGQGSGAALAQTLATPAFVPRCATWAASNDSRADATSRHKTMVAGMTSGLAGRSGA